MGNLLEICRTKLRTHGYAQEQSELTITSAILTN